ncbi:MAG: adenylate/guanylate cyclase domain-containing protein [Candidatus Competibacteraceae bacterium]
MQLIRSLLTWLYLAILRHTQRNGQGKEQKVTILFSDLQDYSIACEYLPPLKVMSIINQYVTVMNKLVNQYHGHVIEFMGDGILAVFGAPHYRTDHAEQALRCAIAMQYQLQQLNQEWRRIGLTQYWRGRCEESMRARIGIHCGTVVIGHLGNSARRKYAVVGNVVNVAARLEALNKELRTDILLSAETCGQLPEPMARELTDLGEFKVKGREIPIRVYTGPKAIPTQRPADYEQIPLRYAGLEASV